MSSKHQQGKHYKIDEIIPFISVKTRLSKGTVVNCHLQVAWPQGYSYVHSVRSSKENEEKQKHCKRSVGQNKFEVVNTCCFHNRVLVRVQRIELCAQPWEGCILATIRYPHVSHGAADRV